MIYLFHGANRVKAKAKMKEVVDGLLKKKPDASFFRVDAENFNESVLSELVGGQGLFVKKYIVVFENLFENAQVKESILERLDEIAESENIFVILEGKMDKRSLQMLEKKAVKSQFFEEKERSRKFALEGGNNLNLAEFNIFSLADAFGRRDKKALWVINEKAKKNCIPAEEIQGLLFWQAKCMALANFSKTAEESGLKPFVFGKAKNFSRNYSPMELKKILSKLIFIYDQAHDGGMPLESSLEKFILEL